MAPRRAEYNPITFVQSARLIQIGRDEKQHPIIRQMGIAEVKNTLTGSANYFRTREKGGETYLVGSTPPKDIAEDILALNPGKWPFPPLVAIVETPVIRPDGSILDNPGYDAVTSLYYAPRGNMEACRVPLKPTQADIDAALALIWDTIGEFPYVGIADKANALGLLLTPIMRPAIRRHIPLCLIDAPKQGTGKGLFSDCVSIIATGETASILTAPDNEAEWDKRITAILMQGRTVITIDNLAGKLQSSTLDGTLTADTKEGRILGQSAMVRVPNRATMIATGNNIKLGGDLPRRSYRIRLDPKVSKPWMRDGFKHADLATWVEEKRAAHIGALLTIARAWYVAGKPKAQDIPALGTFTNWAKTIGGILEHSGVSGFLSNLDALYQDTDEDSTQWEAFLTAWYETFTDAWIPLSEVTKSLAGSQNEIAGSQNEIASNLLDCMPTYLQALYEEKKEKSVKSFTIKLAKALEKRLEACFGADNLRLESKNDKHSKQRVWRVLRVVAGSVSYRSHVEETIHDDSENNNKKSDIEDDIKHYPQLPASTLTTLPAPPVVTNVKPPIKPIGGVSALTQLAETLPVNEALPADYPQTYEEGEL